MGGGVVSASSTSDLVSRVLAKIDEAERIARTVTKEWSAWYVVGVEGGPYGLTYQDIGRTLLAELVDHRAVLSRCAADRRILAEYQDVRHERKKHQGDLGLAGALLALHGVVKRLAEGYGITPEEN